MGGIRKEYKIRIPQQLVPKGPVVNSWNIYLLTCKLYEVMSRKIILKIGKCS